MLHLRLFTVCGLRFDRDDFSPLFQMAILREGDLISARTLAMMNDGRFPSVVMSAAPLKFRVQSTVG